MLNREYDVAVVGLGGLGSATAYWLARRGATGRRVRAVRARSRARCLARPLAHHPPLVPHRRVRRTHRRCLRARGGRSSATPTKRSSLRPVASTCSRRCGDRPAPYRASLDAEQVPYEWLDAARDQTAVAGLRRGTIVSRRRDGDLLGRHRHRAGRPRHGDAATPGLRLRRRPASDHARARSATRPATAVRSTSSPMPASSRRARGRVLPTPGPTGCWHRSAWTSRWWSPASR